MTYKLEEEIVERLLNFTNKLQKQIQNMLMHILVWHHAKKNLRNMIIVWQIMINSLRILFVILD